MMDSSRLTAEELREALTVDKCPGLADSPKVRQKKGIGQPGNKSEKAPARSLFL